MASALKTAVRSMRDALSRGLLGGQWGSRIPLRRARAGSRSPGERSTRAPAPADSSPRFPRPRRRKVAGGRRAEATAPRVPGSPFGGPFLNSRATSGVHAIPSDVRTSTISGSFLRVAYPKALADKSTRWAGASLQTQPISDLWRSEVPHGLDSGLQEDRLATKHSAVDPTVPWGMIAACAGSWCCSEPFPSHLNVGG